MIVQFSLNLNKGANTITRKRVLDEGALDYGFRRLPDIALETINRSIDDDTIKLFVKQAEPRFGSGLNVNMLLDDEAEFIIKLRKGCSVKFEVDLTVPGSDIRLTGQQVLKANIYCVRNDGSKDTDAVSNHIIDESIIGRPVHSRFKEPDESSMFLSYCDGKHEEGKVIGLSSKINRASETLGGTIINIDEEQICLIIVPDGVTYGSDETDLTVHLDDEGGIVELVLGVPGYIGKKLRHKRECEEKSEEERIQHLIYDKVTLQDDPLTKIRRWFFIKDQEVESVLAKFYNPVKESASMLKELSEDMLFARVDGEWYKVTGHSRLGDIWLTKDVNKDTYDQNMRVGWKQVEEWSFDNKL